ncbi:hypothetical protein [Phenylobacterium sp.]|uniref:hypothetical protein n=1 Tax=Phenylobacterium sp. TaxID=1871053 RepID=UPI002FD9788B
MASGRGTVLASAAWVALVPLALAPIALAPPAVAEPLPIQTAPAAAADEPLQPWPYPPPDPAEWWSADWPPAPEAADPLGGRRAPRRAPDVQTPVEPTLYRLWGLPPLQAQVVRRGEAVFEVWRRPSNSVEQVVFRVILRQDGAVFVQGRAGRACCEPQIARRVGFDARLPDETRASFLALARDSAWATPRDAVAQEALASVGSICLAGAAYDLVLLTENGGYALRRDCEPAEIGQAAEILQAVIGAGLGHEPRIDVLFPAGADFSGPRGAYEQLLQEGGYIKAADPPAP